MAVESNMGGSERWHAHGTDSHLHEQSHRCVEVFYGKNNASDEKGGCRTMNGTNDYFKKQQVKKMRTPEPERKSSISANRGFSSVKDNFTQRQSLPLKNTEKK
jgi:hypothetical protein